MSWFFIFRCQLLELLRSLNFADAGELKIKNGEQQKFFLIC
jgi:hypothetical protein